MDVPLFQACGAWQTSSCSSVTLLGSALHKHQHLPKRLENAKQSFFKIPPEVAGERRVHLFIKPSDAFPTEKKKVNNCCASLGSGRECIKREADLGEGEGGRNTKGEEGRRGCHRRTHRMSDKTLLDLFVLLGFSDESHLLWLTAREVHIKEEPSTDKCLFFPHNE